MTDYNNLDQSDLSDLDSNQGNYADWDIVNNSPIQKEFDRYDIAVTDPFMASKTYISQSLDKYENYLTGTQETVNPSYLTQQVNDINTIFGQKIIADSVRLKNTGLYAGLNRSSTNKQYIPSSGFEIRSAGTVEPKGFVSRASDKQWANYFKSNLASNRNEGFVGSFFQFGETNVVKAIMSDSTKSVKIASQVYKAKPFTAAQTVSEFISSESSSAGVFSGAAVTKAAFSGVPNPTKEIIGVTMETGYFHPKVGYFYGSSGEVTKGVFGTQNITSALPKNNTVEEVLFMENINNNKTAGAVLSQIKSLSDILVGVGNNNYKSDSEMRQHIETQFNKSTGSKHQYISLNKNVQIEVLSTLDRAEKIRGHAVVSIQYLENIFLKKSHDNAEFNAFRENYLNKISNLISKGQISILMSDTSIGEGQGLFYLLDKMKSKSRADMTDRLEILGLDVFEQAVVNNVFKRIPTQFAHSKTVTVLNDRDKLDTYFIHSGNFGERAFLENVEAGLKLRRNTLQKLGVDTDPLNEYALAGKNSIANGLYVERKGSETMVNKAIKMLTDIGGVKANTWSEKGVGEAPFIFNTRYSYSDNDYHLSGIDIRMKDKMTFSVTIGQSRTGKYKNGKVELEDTPIVYLNKGNRMITGVSYIYRGSKSMYVNSLGRYVLPGETIDLNPLEVLAGMVHTLHKGSKFDREQRAMYNALERLNQTSEIGLERSVTNASFAVQINENSIKNTVSNLKRIIQTKDLQGVLENNKLIKQMIINNRSVEEFYNREIQKGKASILEMLVDIFAKPHEQSYSYAQKLYDRPVYGIDDKSLSLLFKNFDNLTELSAPALLLGHIDFSHEMQLSLDGRPTIRGVGSTSRLTEQDMSLMPGGLGKARDGTVNVKSLEILNAIPGLRMMDVSEYRKAFTEFVGAKGSQYIDEYINKVFALAKGDKDQLEDDDTILFFPYPKTEQISQRLKNLMSVRPFIEVKKEFADYVRSFGYAHSSIRKTAENNKEFAGSDTVGSKVMSSMPSLQFAIYKEIVDQNTKKGVVDWDSVNKILAKKALDLDDPLHGIIGSSKRMLMNTGISQMADFGYYNMEMANETGYMYSHRSQMPIDLIDINMSSQEFQGLVQRTLKVGTMFVAMKQEISATDEQTKGLYKFLEQKFNDVLKLDAIKDISDKSEQYRAAASFLKNQAKKGVKGYAFGEAFTFVRGEEFRPFLKRGVFNPIENGSDYDIVKIGNLEEGASAFTLNGFYSNKQMGKWRNRIFPIQFANPAISKKLNRGIAILSKDPSIGIVDLRPGSITLNLEYITVQDLLAGMRTSMIKGPMTAYSREYFKTIGDIYSSESMGKTYQIGQEELFGIISHKQMKGFVFDIGYSLLSQGKDSELFKLVKTTTDNAGYKIAEALSLMLMQSTTTKDGKTIQEHLLGTYQRKSIKGRSQFTQALIMAKSLNTSLGGKLKAKGDLSTVEGQNSNTIAIYEGLISLIDKQFIGLGEQGLVETIAKALSADGRKERMELARATKSLFEKMFSNSDYSYDADGSGKRTFAEQKGRSAAILAFMLKAADDLLVDVSSTRLKRKSISELGYYHKDAADNSITELRKSLPYHTVVALASDLASIQTLIKNKDFEGIKNYTQLYNGYDLKPHLAEIRASTNYLYKSNQRIRASYRGQAMALGVYLPAIEEFNKANQIQDLTDRTNKQNLLDSQLELGLYQMFATNQTSKYMEVYVDPGVSRMAVPVGMQEKTDLEGHYAMMLTRNQLAMYTKSAKDAHAITTAQGTLLRLAALVDTRNGLLNESQINSKYQLEHTNVLLLGIDMIKPDRKANFNQEELMRARTLAFTLDFANAYSRISAEIPVRIFGRRVVDSKGRVHKPKKGEVQIPPAYSLFESFLSFSRNPTKDTARKVDHNLDWMTEVTSITTALRAGEESTEVRRNELIDHYMDMIADKTSSLGSQTRNIMEGLLSPILEAFERVGSSLNIFKLTSGSNTQAGLSYHNGVVSYWGPQINNKSSTWVQTTLHVTTDDVKKIQEIESGQLDLNEIPLAERRGLYERTLLARFAKEKRQDLLIALDGLTHTAEIKEVIQFLYKGAPEVERDLLRSIIGQELDNRIESSIAVDPGKEYLEGRQKVRDYAIASFDLLGGYKGYTKVKKVKARIESSLEKINEDLIDPLKTATHSALLVRKINFSKLLDKAENKVNEYESILKIKSTLSYTFAIDIPLLEFRHDDKAPLGTEKVLFTPREHQPFEQGVILGLDILERVSLVFPQYSSEALKAQHAFGEALTIAKRSGVLQKALEAVTHQKDLYFTNEEAQIYHEVIKTAKMSMDSTINITENEKVMRNAMGDQLPMRGASFIAMSSFLISSTEAAFGKERMGTILNLQEAGLKKILRGYAQELFTYETSNSNSALSKKLKPFLEETVKSVNDFAQFIQGDQHTPVKGHQDLFTALETIAVNLKMQNGLKDAHGRYNISKIEKALIAFIGGKDASPEEVRRLESLIFKSQMLVQRGGAPGGTGAAVIIGHQGKEIEDVITRADELNSIAQFDPKANKAVMLISAMGHQFVQLGDYDGDSFQAAINRMAEVTAALAKAQENHWKALHTYSQLQNTKNIDEIVFANKNLKLAENHEKIAREAVAEKLSALNSLRHEVNELGQERIRKYATQFMSLPGFLFEGKDWRTGAIKDEEIPVLVKQYRDTLAGYYENRSMIHSHLSNTLAHTTAIDSVNKSLIVSTEVDIKDKTNAELILKAHLNMNGSTSLDNLSLEHAKQELLFTGAVLSQNNVTSKMLEKTADSFTGSQLGQTQFTELQAIIGSTGTGLLGKTYNTFIPLLAMSAGTLATEHTMNNKKSEELIKAQMAKSIDTQVTNLKQVASVAGNPQYISEIEFLTSLKDKYAVGREEAVKQASWNKLQESHNASFGLMLDIQQFLRDAAIKPKEKGSVVEAAMKFTLQGSGYSWAEGVTGLGKILAKPEATDEVRSKIMEQFIGQEVGYQLQYDYGHTAKGVLTYDTLHLRAFSALQMSNEYLSGKLTASEMMEKSAFSSFLKERKATLTDERNKNKQLNVERLEKTIQTFDLNVSKNTNELAEYALAKTELNILKNTTVIVSDKEIVHDVLANTLSKFRSEFIYGTVLEGHKYGDILKNFGQRIMVSFDLSGKKGQINERVEKYRDFLTNSIQGSPTNSQSEDILKQVDAFRSQELEYQKVIENAASTGGTDLASKSKTIFRALIEYESSRQSTYYAEMFDSLIEVNKAMAVLKSGETPTSHSPETAKMFEVAFATMLQRGNLDPSSASSIAYDLTRMATQAKNSTGGPINEKNAMALLSVSGTGVDSLPEVQSMIEGFSTVQADLAVKQKFIKEQLLISGETDQGKLNLLETHLETNLNKVDDTQEKILMRSGAEWQTKKTESQKQLTEQINTVITLGNEKSVAVLTAEANTLSSHMVSLHNENAVLKAKSGTSTPGDQQYWESIAKAKQDEINNLSSMNHEDQVKWVQQKNDILNSGIAGINQTIRQIGYAEYRKEMTEQITKSDSKQKVKHGVGGLLSLLAIPTVFSLMQGDVTFNDRVVEMLTNVVQAGVGSISYQESSLRKALYASSQQELEGVKLSKAEKAAHKANRSLQGVRIHDFVRRDIGTTEGLIQGIAFESIYAASSVASTQLFGRIFGNNVAANAVAEIAGGVIGMSIANILTSRPVPGSYATYDYAWDITIRMVKRIKDSILQASSQAAKGLVGGNEDEPVYDARTGEMLYSLDDLLREGDVDQTPDSSALNYIQRMALYTNEVDDIQVEDSGSA